MYMDDIYTYTNSVQGPEANTIRFNSPSGIPGLESDVGCRYERELLTRFVAPVSYEQAHNTSTIDSATRNEAANMPCNRYASQVRNENSSSGIDSNIGDKNEMKYMYAGSVNTGYPVPVGNLYGNNYVSSQKEDIVTCVPRNFAVTSPTRKDVNCDGPNIATHDFMNKLELERANVHNRFAPPATGETVVSPVRNTTELSTNHDAIENYPESINYTGRSQSAARENSDNVAVESKAVKLAEGQRKFEEQVTEGTTDNFKMDNSESKAAKTLCDRIQEELQKSDSGKAKTSSKLKVSENTNENSDFEVEVLTDDSNMNAEGSTTKKTRIVVKIAKTATKQTNPDTQTSGSAVEKCQMSGCHDSLAKQENPDTLTADISKKKCYECQNCNKIYKRRDHLARHMQTAHSELRPFLCRVCSHTFSRKDRLTRHEKIHSGAPQFSCNSCEKHFFRRDSLTKHLRTCKKSTDDSVIKCV